MAKGQMVINYVPGEECRVAVVYDGKLNELHAERMDNVSHVGNIYVGKVVNVEAAIQAAFVDFGLEHNGFLHVSDLHPQYFPDANDATTERVGKKTPRRDRPPIQECLRRGQEIAVQVLKEGVGTKGPTVTSYLSIPGRFLVMMPQMDRVGVSRKVEDEDTRRKMREILDQLDLPDGFGFILRTAGMDRGKLELKRDLAYLSRLWKDMEKRWKSGNKPRLLYSESDLLVRALRDILSSDIEEVVVDNDSAMQRAARFLKIVAPRSTSKLVHYTGKTPIFHAMGLEEQIQMIHAREVPLPSGGRLVIDETEALVAIDVNSGKSRDARDAETNAFRTNMEAAEEICRQLRLRDLGGVIVNDLIDMRFTKHRREVENKFKDLLKKDRARWTTAPISEFGILEMTRQRMRGSHESQHFADCPTCRGRGLVQRPDSVAADGLRDLAATLDHDRVHRVEMVVHPRIAGELLSTKRRALSRIERSSGKHVDVRVSDAIPVDRLTFYAYDDRGADIDVSKLGRRKLREDELVEFVLPKAAPVDDWGFDTPAAEPEPIEEPDAAAEVAPHPIEIDPEDLDDNAAPPRPGDLGGGERRGRRRRRRGRRGRGGEAGPATGGREQGDDAEVPARGRPDGDGDEPRGADAPALASQNGFHAARPAGDAAAGEGGEAGGRRRRRRRRRGRGGRGGAPGQPMTDDGAPAARGDAGPSDDADAGEFESSDGGRLEVGAGSEHESDAWDGEADGASASTEPPFAAESGDRPNTTDRGPDGGPVSEGGDHGGRRRRRRRRRGGRGRGGDRGQPVGGAPVDGPEGSWSEGAAPAGRAGGEDHADGESRFDNAPSGEGYAGTHAATDSEFDDDEGGNTDGDGPSGQAEPVEAGANQPGGGERGGEEGGGRRRRRRRRGRGGRGGGSGPSDNGEFAGGERVNERRDQSARGPGGPDRGRSDRGGPDQRDRGRDSSPQGGGGSGAAGSNAGGARKPRTLYASRRRLGPGERPRGADE